MKKTINTISFLILIFSAVLILNACQHASNKEINTQKLLEKKGISLIEYDDEEMIEAIKKARTTFNEFETLIESPDERYFAIKIGILYPGGKEHLWVTDVIKEDSVYFGRVDNQPEYTDKVNLNDLIEIPKNIISDWMVIENNQIIAGGYTLKLIRSRMNPEEKAKFDQQSQLYFDSVN